MGDDLPSIDIIEGAKGKDEAGEGVDEEVELMDYDMNQRLNQMRTRTTRTRTTRTRKIGRPRKRRIIKSVFYVL
jgi:hypothetical protein